MDLLGSKLVREYDVDLACIVYLKPTGKVKCSLRSINTKQDVEIIATSFGGGGHRNAAGFEMSLDEFMGLFV